MNNGAAMTAERTGSLGSAYPRVNPRITLRIELPPDESYCDTFNRGEYLPHCGCDRCKAAESSSSGLPNALDTHRE